jgi:hypothetical protein
LRLLQCEDIPIEDRFQISSARHEIAHALLVIRDPEGGLRTQLDSAAFIATLPGGIRQDLERTHQAYSPFQSLVAIRHWTEIPDTDGESVSQWTCDGYTSSRQGAGMIAEALHKSSGHNYEVWSLRPLQTPGRSHILDFVPGIKKGTAPSQNRRRGVTEQEVMYISEQWCIDYYGIHDSNYQYIRALTCKPPSRNRVWECTVQFSQSGEQVTCLLHNLLRGLNVFGLRYEAERGY